MFKTFVSSRISALVLVALGLNGAAHADDDFSNLGFPISGSGYLICGGSQQEVGIRFTSGLTGSLTGFQLAINSIQTTQGVQYPFAVSLYTNSASDTLGTLLGTFSGLSTGNYPATSVLATGAASGPSLDAGAQYWIVASSNVGVVRNLAEGAQAMPGYVGNPNGPIYVALASGAFSVQVTPVPEPVAFVPLGAGVLALARRRTARK